ncbi:hypothetical protein AAFC00_001165 [Neodothiora populina]|uniref:FAD-binding domain-containing protein n=1 Tax=Neodothiora populina TaxID=2781224 RepID=A0ABR3PNE1_9PEZI
MGARFNIIIVGGGLAGLASALFLRRHGHIVTVIEAAKQLSEVGAGIQIPPNGTRILDLYGLMPKLEEIVVKPSHINLRRYANGVPIGKTPLVPEMVESFGFPYWVIHRADYLNLLHKAALDAGVQIRLACKVIDVDEEAVSVLLEDGTRLHSDLIIGADGIRSPMRASILGSENVEVISSPNCAYRAIISREKMMSDPRSAELMNSPAADCWIGPGRHIMSYPIRGGTSYNIVMSHPGKASVGKWNEPGDIGEMNRTYEKFDTVIRHTMSYIDTALKWTLADIPTLPRWRSHSGRVVLVGDAAHAMLPYLSQGAAQAMEDAAILAQCLDRAGHVDDLPRLLAAYEVIRKPRAERLQQGARRNGVVWHFADGEDQQRRDWAMQGDLKEGEVNPNVWADKGFQPWLFGYDAVKDANERLEIILRQQQQPQSRL